MSEYIDFGFENARGSHSHAYLSKPLLKLLGENKNQKILDLGCGNGSLTRFLIQSGYDAYGIDASKKGIEIAQEFYPDRFAVQNLESDDLPPEFREIGFNAIISTEVIEHLYHPAKLIQFSKKILIKNGGGDLIISTPYHGYLKNLIISVSGKWDSHMPPQWDGGHIKMWSRKTLTRLLEADRFKVSDFKGCGRVPYLWKSMIIKAYVNP